MSLAGPRLDRPSAIGDDGRPRAASLWIATIVVAALVGVIGILTDESSLLPTLATVVGLAVAGAALLERESFVPLFVGHLLLVTFGSVLAALVLVGPLLDRGLFVAAGCAVALSGIAAAWADVGGDDLTRATRATAISYLSMVVSGLFAAILLGIAIVGWVLLAGVSEASTPMLSVVGFLIVVMVASGGLGLGLRWLPIRQLSPRSSRDRVERYLAGIQRSLLLVVLCSPAPIVAAVILWLWGGVDEVIDGTPSLEWALEGLSSPVLVRPLVALGLGSVLLGVLAVFLRRLTRQISVETNRDSVAAIVGAVLTAGGVLWLAFLVVALVVGAPQVVWRLTASGTPVAVLLLVGPLAILFVGGVGALAGALRLMPSRATGPAVAATGLLLAAVGLGRGEPALVFACIAGALLVWDVSTFGLGLTAELGHLPETRRLELFHGVVAVGVAGSAVLVAVGLEALRTGLFADIGGTGGAVVIALGALLLLVPLRG